MPSFTGDCCIYINFECQNVKYTPPKKIRRPSFSLLVQNRPVQNRPMAFRSTDVVMVHEGQLTLVVCDPSLTAEPFIEIALRHSYYRASGRYGA